MPTSPRPRARARPSWPTSIAGRPDTTEHYRRPAGGYRLVVCLERQRAFRQGLGHRPTERNETVATLAVYRTEEVGQSLDFAEWLLGVVVEKTGGVTIAPEHERPVVELALGAEALGQPASPGALLAGRPVIRAWNYVLEPREGPETGRLGEPCADEDVLVGERQTARRYRSCIS